MAHLRDQNFDEIKIKIRQDIRLACWVSKAVGHLMLNVCKNELQLEDDLDLTNLMKALDSKPNQWKQAAFVASCLCKNYEAPMIDK